MSNLIPNPPSKREGPKVWTGRFRGGFVNLLKPKKIPGTDQEAQFSMMLLFGDDADLSHMREAVKEAAKNKWGDEAKKVVKNPKFRDPFKNQSDMVDKTGSLYAGMEEGCQCVQASCKQSYGPPQVIDINKNDLIDASEVYSGAYYRATVNAYAWEHSVGGKGVSFGLSNVQKLAEGEKLGGGRSNVQDDFEALETANDNDAWDDAA